MSFQFFFQQLAEKKGNTYPSINVSECDGVRSTVFKCTFSSFDSAQFCSPKRDEHDTRERNNGRLQQVIVQKAHDAV